MLYPVYFLKPWLYACSMFKIDSVVCFKSLHMIHHNTTTPPSQVAAAPHTGVSRGFAFVDMSSSKEAEHAQLACNGGTFRGHEIRVSFGMPCRHGACILQHRHNGLHSVSCT